MNLIIFFTIVLSIREIMESSCNAVTKYAFNKYKVCKTKRGDFFSPHFAIVSDTFAVTCKMTNYA